MLGLFKVIIKVLEVIYKLDLLLNIKIYPVQYIIILEPVYRDIIILEPVYRDIKPLLYKIEIYRG